MVIEVFGKVLRELRVANNISQEKLAEYCDLDRTYISLLERGQRQPTVTTIFKLAKALKLSPSALIEKVEKLVKE
ncbi:MAG: helix-turn-helix domain-containing protein [Prolixibacteraceae bacterium]|nr:helix-turn-helix domain-containing protein [Prolixibacteraceae bacterium]